METSCWPVAGARPTVEEPLKQVGVFFVDRKRRLYYFHVVCLKDHNVFILYELLNGIGGTLLWLGGWDPYLTEREKKRNIIVLLLGGWEAMTLTFNTYECKINK